MTATNSSYSMPGAQPQPPSVLEAALAYAKQGIPVFPLHSTDGRGNCSCSLRVCANPGKHPRTKNGLSNATTNEFFIRQWWQRWPDANVGACTGYKFVVLDTDDGDAGLVEAQAYDVDLNGLRSTTGDGRRAALSPANAGRHDAPQQSQADG